jgi:hypothetical protein
MADLYDERAAEDHHAAGSTSANTDGDRSGADVATRMTGASASPTVAEEIFKLNARFKTGAISEQEFNHAKKLLLTASQLPLPPPASSSSSMPRADVPSTVPELPDAYLVRTSLAVLKDSLFARDSATTSMALTSNPSPNRKVGVHGMG